MDIQAIEDVETIVGQANIAQMIDPKGLKHIGKKVLEEFDLDFQSNAEERERLEDAMKQAKQAKEKKNTPWPNASNVKYPLITVAAIQFNARAYPALIPNQHLVKGKVIGSDNGIPVMDQNGQPVMNQQTQQPEWQVPPGAKKARAKRVSEHMSYQLLDEMEEWVDDTDTLLITLPIVGCMFRKMFYDPIMMRNRSKLLGPDEVIVHKEADFDTTPRISQCFRKYHYEIEQNKRIGLWLDVDLNLKDDKEDKLEEFIEQHTRLDLDNDGYAEPYIVTVHKDSREVVRVAPNFAPDDIKRNADGVLMKIDPIRYFIRYQLLPDPDGGVYGMGLGHLMLPLNESVNTLINQLIDSGTLANQGGGFIGRGIRTKKGPVKLKMGEYITVDTGVGGLRENIMPNPTQQPSAVLQSLLVYLVDAAKDISSVQDIMTGQVQQATQPTTALALIEQGMRVFTGIYKRIHRSLKKEMKLLYKLNSKFLTDQEYFNTMDNMMAVARSDYAEGVDILPISDPNMASDTQKQKQAEIMMSQVGLPWVNGQKVTLDFFKALGVDDPESYFVTPQPDPQVLIDIARLENDKMRASATVLETKIKAVEMLTQSIKNLADAKDSETGLSDKEIDKLAATVAIIANYIGGLDANEQGSQGMDGASGNGVVPSGNQGTVIQ